MNVKLVKNIDKSLLSQTVKLFEPKIFDQINILPEITNLQITNSNSETVKNCIFYFRISSSLDHKNTSWLLNPKILERLNLKFIFVLDKDLENQLKTNRELLFQLDRFNKNHFIVIDRKINSTSVNLSKEIDENGNAQLSATFFEKISLSSRNFDTLSVFKICYLDANSISTKFDINAEKISDIFAKIDFEQFIENSEYINSKISDISSLKNVSKLDLSDFRENITSILGTIVKLPDFIQNQALLGRSYISDLYYSKNKLNNFYGIFLIEIQSIFIEKARFNIFFFNPNFRKTFFSNKNNFTPKRVYIKRQTEDGEYEIILNEKYSSHIDSKSTKFDEIKLKDIEKYLVLSFQDKESNKLYKKYKYSIILEFPDKTIDYLENIKTSIYKHLKNIQEIINIANSGNYYDLYTNKFDLKLNIELSKHNLSISESLLETAKILSLFSQFSSNQIKSLTDIIKTQNYNFEILDSINNILSLMNSQITFIQNRAMDRVSSDIIIEKTFKDWIELGDPKYSISIFESDISKAYSKITSSKLNQRISQEILKYYTNDTTLKNTAKYSYLTPYILNSSLQKIPQFDTKINQINHEAYNIFILNYIYQKYFDDNITKVSKGYKLYKLLKYFNLSTDKFFIDQAITKLADNKVTTRGLKTFDVSDIQFPKQIEDFLFAVFIMTVVNKDNKISDFPKISLIKENSEIPFQLNVVKQIFDKNSFTRETLETFKDNIENPIKQFSTYMNFKKIYQLQYLDLSDLSWKILTSDIISKNNKTDLICKYISYLNSDIDLYDNKDLEFYPIDQIFVLTGDIILEAPKDINVSSEILKREDLTKSIITSEQIKPKQSENNVGLSVQPLVKITK